MSDLFPYMIPFMFFPAMLFFISFMIRNTVNRTSGWVDLEATYKTKKKPKESRATDLKIKHCNFGGINANNLFRFYETQEGLLITKSWFIGRGDYNVLIPWSQFVESRERKFFFWKIYRVVIGRPFVSFVDFREKDYKKIKSRFSIDKISQPIARR